MRKPVIGALLSALALAGCGGASHTASTPVTTAQTSPAPQTTPTSPVPTTSMPTTTTATTTRTPTTTTTSPPPTTSTSSASGGAPVTTTPTTTTTTIRSGSSPTPQQVAEAKKAYPGCSREQPGITLKQLEQEAASPEGIQC